MKHKILLTTALLCIAVQGTWADTWDGSSTKRPAYDSDRDCIVIRTAAELAYIRDCWDDKSLYEELYYLIVDYNKEYYKWDYILEADLDMSAASWEPMGGTRYYGTFNGNGHTIRIKIEDTSDNYQGLFETISRVGKVTNLHLDGKIKVGNARMVGGIAGNNYGTIENCWVSADVESDHYHSSKDADLGGICGWNESDGKIKYCCMTGNVTNTDGNSGVGGIAGSNDGTIQHVTFYGSVSVDHDQDNKWVGDQDKTLENQYDSFNQSEYDASSDNDMYRKAIKYPYALTVRTEGYGSVQVSSWENDITRWYPGGTVKLTKKTGLVSRIDIKDADGNWVYSNGDINGTLEFTMPKRDVNITVVFGVNWPKQGAGTESDPYIIGDLEDWNQFAYYVNNGNSYSGKYVKLTADINVTQKCGTVSGSTQVNPFSGNFDGGGHTITANITDSSNQGTALFSYINGATIKNLKVAGTINSSQKHAAAIVGFSKGTGNSIVNCAATANVNGNEYIGGILGHAIDSDISISGCTFSGLMKGGDSAKGAIFGWGDNGGIKSVTDCLYIMQEGQDTKGLDLVRKYAGDVKVTNSYKTTAAGSQGTLVYTVAADNEIYRPVTAADGNTYYIHCAVSGVENSYKYTGNVITIVPTITAADGTVLTEGTDYTYTFSPDAVQEKGEYTMTITANGNSYIGTKTFHIILTDGTSVTSATTTLTTGEYVLNSNQDVNERITISGDVVLHFCEGFTYTAKKGIELSEGNSLTIDGFGTLIIDGCDSGKSGIGANSVGSLTISGVTVNVTGGDYAAAIGGDKNNAKGGSITINGGAVNAKGGKLAAGIGGGADDQPGHYGVCGDITINGGQVTAQSGYRSEKYWRYGNMAGIGPGAEKPNPEGDYYDSGTLKLGWTKPTDFIDCNGFVNPQGSTLTSITFANGKEFMLEGTETVATIENCRGKKIVPPIVPYIISNTAEWNDFVSSVNSGNSYKGKFVKLTADISVTEKVGTVKGNVQQNAFSGTFDGDGHTITATITDNSNQGAALFSYINGATIKNLKVAGTINSSQKHAAAIVGFSKGTGNSIVNCAATANVNGNEYIGGILGHAIDSDISISGCTFSGLMTGGSKFQGAIIGWGDSGTRKVTDCLYIMQDGQDTRNLELVKNSGKMTVTNTYKTTKAEQGGSQPKSTRSLTPSLSPEGEEVPSDSSEVNTDDDEIDDSIYDAIWANEYDTMPDYFGNFVMDYGFLKVYEGGLEYDGKYYVANILVADDADNYALINLTAEYIVDVTLTGRTFYKDGTWQTICLPFDLSELEGTPLEGAKVKMLGNAGGCTTGFDTTTGTLTLDFVDADRIEAGKPYIVKWNSGGDIVNPVFRGVTISDEDPIEQRTMSEDERVHFLGIYCPALLEANNYANLYLGPDGKLHCPEADGFYLNAFRAGFLVDLGDVVTPSSIVINLNDGTGIRSIDNGQLIIDNSWYSLDGRKLQGKPSRAGVYINNGIKRVVK